MKILPLLLVSALFTHAASAQDTLSSHVYNLSTLPVIKDSSRLRVQMMDGGTPYLVNLEAHLTTLEPGQSAHPPHTHYETEELIIIKEGTIKMTIKGRSKLLGPGGLALSLPGDEHGTINAGKTKASYYVIKFAKALAAVNTAKGEQAGGSIIMDWPEVKAEKTDKGERRNFFNRPSSLFDKFDMHVTTLNKGQVSHPPHTHKQEEIILIKEGNVSMHIGDKFYPAKAGDLIFLSSGVPHALENAGNEATTYFAFQWQ